VVVFDGVTHLACLEAMSCREGIALALDLNIGPVMIATDCLEVVKGLQGKTCGGSSTFSARRQAVLAAAAGHASAMKVVDLMVKLTS
jgi:hypothetical protein